MGAKDQRGWLFANISHNLVKISGLYHMRHKHALTPRRFLIPNSSQELVFTEEVLQVFSDHRQEENAPEGGGLLFAEFDFPAIKVIQASPPNATDKRWRTLFVPNRVLQRKLIKEYFYKGWHFIGEWHTHPEPVPHPSQLDLQSMADAFRKSRHELGYFVMVIVGNRKQKLELWVSAHNSSEFCQLDEFTWSTFA